jgi:IS30 family transposase
VQNFLQLRWSPEQIAMKWRAFAPKVTSTACHTETIYNCIYAQSVGELRRELIACLRYARNKRVPRSKRQDRCGQIPDMLNIHMRPPDIEDGQRAAPMRLSMTCDQGREMAPHKKLTEKTSVAVYFCGPHSP